MQMNFYTECKIDDMIRLESLYTFSRRRFQKDYLFKGESHDFHEVVCVIDGKAGITADKNVRILSVGQINVHLPNEYHKIWSDGEEMETIIFSFRARNFPQLDSPVYQLSREQLSELKNLYLTAEKIFCLEKNNVKEIKKGMERDASIFLKRLEIFLLSVFSSNDVSNVNYSSRSAENYTRILSVMDENLHLALSGSEIARLCAISVPTLEKTMIKFAGKSAMAYYNDMKMRKATELLLNGASVKETAILLGFSNQNYFSARYKKWSGSNPSTLKK